MWLDTSTPLILMDKGPNLGSEVGRRRTRYLTNICACSTRLVLARQEVAIRRSSQDEDFSTFYCHPGSHLQGLYIIPVSCITRPQDIIRTLCQSSSYQMVAQITKEVHINLQWWATHHDQLPTCCSFQ